MLGLTPDLLAAIAAALSAFATIAAAYAAWRVPKSAAILSETLRREAEQDSEQKRLKLFVFTTIMQERASVFSAESVRALNLIDVVFNDSEPVREAWAELYNAFNARNASPFDHDSKLRALLKVMSEDIGLGSKLKTDDLGRVYFPNSLAEEHEVQHLERKAALQRLKGPPSGQHKPLSLFPPKPEE
ncbi:DUF6680 family protein [Mameliella alba]|uniref:DUF6680 family protein n=1 Tax=Mameliella alba TaxID=561184 RepID=UPI001054E555|nr:DUF6680 family protein [Mameliella alba]GGF42724.1 hypothetical protein GCM10011319_00640 [Mameliella alba]